MEAAMKAESVTHYTQLAQLSAVERARFDALAQAEEPQDEDEPGLHPDADRFSRFLWRNFRGDL